MTPRAWSMLALLTLILLPAVMLYPLWQNPTSAGEDDVLYYYPVRVTVGEAMAEGTWPIHDERVAGGTPVFGDPQAAVLFPTTWLFAIWPAKLAYSVSLFVAFALSGVGMWVYLRSLGLCRRAAWMGAVAMMFCGFMVGHRVHLSMLQTAAFLPWGLAALERLRTDRLRSWLLLVPVMSLAVLGGHWPTVIHMGLIWVAYVALRVRPLRGALPVLGGAGVLVVLVCWPQIEATLAVMQQVTRERIGYATAGENSYFPAAAVLWFFPFLMGSRTPNLYEQSWWGPWHLCEMLGYVGLITLVLAGAALWRLWRRGEDDCPQRLLVRTWGLIAGGALVFMLGYYLPTYRLIHALPVLGVVRCPARMILAVDAALATLAAVAVHGVLTGGSRAGALRTSVRRGASRRLPVVMSACLLLVLLGGLLGLWLWGGGFPMPFAGGPWQALMALRPWQPAVLLPVALLIATVASVKVWLASPRRAWPLVAALLLIDLTTVTLWVDVPSPDAPGPDPERSPAAQWLVVHGGAEGNWRVWGLGDPYGHRQPELLLARTNTLHDISTISTYGPFQSAAHAHLLGFRIYGTNSEWQRLVRENRLLGLYGVRYLLAEEGSEEARVIASVRWQPGREPAGVGENLLPGFAAWEADNVEEPSPGVVSLSTPLMWWWSRVRCNVTLQGGQRYRMSLEARAPDGAANFLQAEVLRFEQGGGYFRPAETSLVVQPEQLGDAWRRFEQIFVVPDEVAGAATFRLFTMSERPIEIRDVRLQASGRWEPKLTDPPVEARDVYQLVAACPAVRAEEPPVLVFENRFWSPQTPPSVAMSAEQIEAFRWADAADVAARPAVGVKLQPPPQPGQTLRRVSLPAVAAWLILAIGGGLRRRYFCRDT